MFRTRKRKGFFSNEVIGRIEAADGRIIASAGLLVALSHEKAAADVAAVVAAYAATVPTPPAGPAAGADLEACRQHLAAIQAILGTL